MEDPIRRFIEIVADLRGEHGCPWDKEQTHESIRPCLVEEAAELLDAIESKDDANMIEELGDVMMQVIFHSQIAAEEGRFTIDDVAQHACDKLVSRHPHVFGPNKVADAHSAYLQWESIKKTEKEKQDRVSAISGVPRHLPALQRAEKYAKKAAKVGFAWPSDEGALAKIKEEIAEVEEALKHGNQAELEEELGDLLFATAVLSYRKGCYGEDILHRSIKKFEKRFMAMEELLKDGEKTFDEMNIEELKLLWKEAKKK